MPKGRLAAPPAEGPWNPWWLLACALGAALIAFGPALNGQLIFDDIHLPFADPNAAGAPAGFWIGGVRPILMATYWANFLISGRETFSYHLVNVVLHAVTAVLMFAIFKHTLALAGSVSGPIRHLKLYALAGAGIFLLHPLQTESVDYLAGRSEVLSGLLFCAAWLVFLRNFESETMVLTSLKILVLGGAAVLAKENAICLPAVLLATDVFWAKRPFAAQMRRRLKLYVPFALGGLGGAAIILRSLTAGTAAGFSSGSTPLQFALTQCRVILIYVRLFFLPVGQNGDWALPIFRSPTEGGACLYAAGAAALIALAIWLYPRQRLASFGIAIFLLMLAPTSSVVPLKDALAERRMYMPVAGLILASIAPAMRLDLSAGHLRAAVAAVLLTLAALTWQRSLVWVSPLAFWSDSVEKNAANPRAHFGLGGALMTARDCKGAAGELHVALSADPSDYLTLWDLAEAYECSHEPERSLALFQQFNKAKPSAEGWNRIAYNQGRLGLSDEVLVSVENALRLDPNNAVAYAYRGLARFSVSNADGAREDFQHALTLDPQNQVALDGMKRVDALRDK